MQERESKRLDWRRLAGKRWLWWVAGLVLIVNLALVIAPYGIAYSLERWVLAQGLEKARVADVDFNPFTGRLVVRGLEASVGGRTVARIPLGEVDLGWAPLWRKRVYLEQVTLRGADIVLSEQEDGSWRYAGVTPPWEREVEAVETPSAPWGVGARELLVVDSLYRIEGRAVNASLAVQEGRLTRASSWQPDEAAELALEGRINGAQFALQVRAWPFAGIPKANGHVKLTALSLAPLGPVARPEVKALDGVFDLDMTFEGQHTADTGLDIRHEGVMAVHGMKLQSQTLDHAAELLRWQGSTRIVIPPSGMPRVVADGSLKHEGLTASVPAEQLSVQHGASSWDGHVDYAMQEGGTNVETDGTLEVRDLNVALAGETAREERLAWEGRVMLGIPAKGGHPAVTAQGKLEAAKLAVIFRAEKAFRQDGLSWRGKLSYAPRADGRRVHMVGRLEARQLSLSSPEAKLEEERLNWDGSLILTLSRKEDMGLEAAGKLDGGGLAVGLPGRDLTLGHAGFSWEGRLIQGGPAQAGEPAKSGLEMRGLEIRAPARGLRLLAVDKIGLEDMRLDRGEKIQVGTIQVDQLTLVAPGVPSGEPAGEAKPSLLTAPVTTVEAFELTRTGRVSIGAIQMKGGEALLRRAGDRRWYLLEDLKALSGERQAPGATGVPAPALTAERPGRPPAVRPAVSIDLVSLKQSQLRIEDDAVEPPFRTTLRIAEAHMTHLVSDRPEQRSELGLQAKLGKYTEVRVRAQVRPFDERLGLDMKAHVDGLEMPPLAPYTIQQVGYTFTSGEVDADVDMKVDQGQIQGEARLVFTKLEVEAQEARNAEKAREVQETREAWEDELQRSKLNMPIGTALSLLRDRDNNIRLRVPISGDADNPQFSPQDAINKALGKASRKAALTYLKFAIQPYGAIITGVEVAGKAVFVIRLDPVTFNTGDATLTESGKRYLEKVAKVLKDRPQVQIKVCGKAVENDRQVLQAKALAKLMAESGGRRGEAGGTKDRVVPAAPLEPPPISDAALKALAKARGEEVKDHVVEKHAVDAGRLILCGPRLEAAEYARPRVDLQI